MIQLHSMMNAHDLTMAAIRGTPDRIPFNPIVMHLAAALSNQDFCHIYCRRARDLVAAQIRCANFFGIHHVHVMSDAYREASAWGVGLNWNGNTPDLELPLRIEDFDSIETPDLQTAERTRDRLEAIKLFKQQVGGSQCILGWIEAPFAELTAIFGLKQVVRRLKKPEFLREMKKLLDRIIPVQREFAQLQIEAGADLIGAGDAIISQIGPKWYEEITLNATRSLFTEIKKQVPVLYHICGDNTLVDAQGRDMTTLIGSTGADIFDFDFQVDFPTARGKIGSQPVLRGNTNTQILGSEEYTGDEVVRAVIDTLEKAKTAGRFMYGAGCEWPWMPLDLAIRNMSIAQALVALRK